MYSPVPNAYFAKYIQQETQQDSSQSTASQPGTCTPVKQEAQPSTEFTDEELMLALSQAEEQSETTVNASHDDAERISDDSQVIHQASNLLSDAHRETENHDVSPPGEEQTNLGSGVSGEEGATLVDEEMNLELSSEVASGERAEESNVTSPSDEADNGTYHSSGQDLSSASSTDHGNTTWISCTVGKMIDLNVNELYCTFAPFLYSHLMLEVTLRWTSISSRGGGGGE